MKRVRLFIIGFMLALLATNAVSAMTLEEAIASKDPFVMMIYTKWSKYQEVYDNLKEMQVIYKQYNFVKVDMDSPDAANIFKEKRFIVSDMPMIIVAKNGGRINKAISNDCAKDLSCVSKVLKHF